MDSDLTTLMSRIEQLEGESQALRKEITALCGLLGFPGERASQQKMLGPVWCEMLSVGAELGQIGVSLAADEKGGNIAVCGADHRARVYLDADRHGGVALTNHAGQQVVLLQATEDQGMVSVFSSDQRHKMGMLVSNEGSFFSLIRDNEPQVSMHTNERGGRIDVHALDGSPRGSLSNGADLDLWNHQDQLCVMLGHDQDGGMLSISSDGQAPGVLVTQNQHGGCLAVNHKTNRSSVALSTNDAGGTLLVCGPDGHKGILQQISEHGGLVTIHGTDGHPRTSLSVSDAGGQVSVFNDDFKLQGSLHVGPLGGIVSVQGIDGQDRAGVWVEDSGGKIGVFDDDKNLKASMQAESLGGSMCVISADFPQVVLRADWDGGQLILFGQNELPGATLSLTDSGGSLQLFDAQGQPRTSLPNEEDAE